MYQRFKAALLVAGCLGISGGVTYFVSLAVLAPAPLAGKLLHVASSTCFLSAFVAFFLLITRADCHEEKENIGLASLPHAVQVTVFLWVVVVALTLLLNLVRAIYWVTDGQPGTTVMLEYVVTILQVLWVPLFITIYVMYLRSLRMARNPSVREQKKQRAQGKDGK